MKALIHWFLSTKRDLPWRDNPSPYAVWVSEVMLQQTQVSVVIPYFLRWMERYPTVEALAEASLDQVIKSWEGLGYYSRARNLHAGARYLVEHHAGQLPADRESLSKIKGLGDYTIGAILSFAFHQKVAAVDGNVVRVLSRYFLIEEDVCKAKTQRIIKDLAMEILPDITPWIHAEALIELGATICTKKAKCVECPLKSSCKAFSHAAVDRLPYKSVKIRVEYLFRAVPLIVSGNKILLRRAEKGEIMSDLHEFPYFETEEKGITSLALTKEILNKFNLHVKPVQSLAKVSHGFTRYQAALSPYLFSTPETCFVDGYQWVSLHNLNALPFSSGHRRILNILNALDPALIDH